MCVVREGGGERGEVKRGSVVNDSLNGEERVVRY